ncbi:tyrosine-type recombinase/integrase [Pseudonocardia bannensis]
MVRAAAPTSWYSFACDYVDMKWPGSAANTRRSTAEALAVITLALLRDGRVPESGQAVRTALRRWAFNTVRRTAPDCPREVQERLRWVAANTRPLSELADTQVLRGVFDAMATNLDGSRSAGTVVRRRRAILFNALEYAVELDLLSRNPVESLKWRAPKVSHAVDRRSVVNPYQARTLLRALAEERPKGARSEEWVSSGPRLVAFFALIYYAALRPEEAVNLRRADLVLPKTGWGEIHLERATPDAGRDWTDNGSHRDERQLKHRAKGEVRVVPCTPELTGLLHVHIEAYGIAPDGRLFTGLRGGELARSTYHRAWIRARKVAFTPEVYGSALAKTPYSLRHACVSTWLNGGVPPTQVAEWAGHSVDVLLKVYAKCLEGQDAEARRRALAALGAGPA